MPASSAARRSPSANARDAFKAGDYPLAETWCRVALKKAKSDWDALHILGVVRLSQGRPAEALPHIEDSLRVNPRNPDAHNNRGIALAKLGRFDDALAAYAEALRLKPNFAEVFNNQANALRETGRLEDSLESSDQAIRLRPDYFEGFSGRARTLVLLNRLEEAADAFDRALAANPSDFDLRLNRGAVRLRVGRPEEALSDFERALAQSPDAASAHGHKANALRALKRFEEALASHDRALALDPQFAEGFNNRGNALVDLQRFDEAFESYAQAIQIRPDYKEAFNNRGALHTQLGRREDALADFEAALRVDPDFLDALSNRAGALQALGRREESLAAFERLLVMKPEVAEFHNNRGTLLAEAGRHAEALAAYDTCIGLKPEMAQAHNNRGNALRALNRYADGLESFDRALALDPLYAQAHSNRSAALTELQRPVEALDACDRALELDPNFPAAHLQRGNALSDLQRYEEAEASFSRAIELDPVLPEAHNNRGNALKDLGRPDEALAGFERALELKGGEYPSAEFNRALVLLSAGDYEQGWKGYEQRWFRQYAPKRNLTAPWPEWRGEPLEGRTLVVYEEQGLGDVLQFSRYLREGARRGAKVTFLARRHIHKILAAAVSPEVELNDVADKNRPFDFQAPLIDFAARIGAFDTDDTAAAPYLAVEPERVARWREALGASGFKIGVVWQGNPAGKIDAGRSYPLAKLAAIAALPGVRLISLQKNFGLDQLKTLPEGMKVETLGDAFDAGPDAFLDTAAVMESLDLVITSDTSLAHLAGALHRPVWTALKRHPDWRWRREGAQTGWYPTMRLYRQAERGDWDSAFAAMTDDLRSQLAARRAREILIPGSIGELIDKLTILELKTAKFPSGEKKRNVEYEFAALSRLERELAPLLPDVSELRAALKAVNARLWDIEDEIRDCERRQDFGEAFVGLARSVYISNDQRSAIKREINVKCGSSIVEEKSY